MILFYFGKNVRNYAIKIIIDTNIFFIFINEIRKKKTKSEIISKIPKYLPPTVKISNS